MEFSDRETQSLQLIQERDASLRAMLRRQPLPSPPDPVTWFNYFAEQKRIQGNLSNTLGYLTTLLAKQFLSESFDIGTFDAAEKAQGAVGPDIDITLSDGQRIIAEIKTTSPYHAHDFGANQRKEILRDCEKLGQCGAEHRFFFVTDSDAFELLATNYRERLAGVTLVNLVTRNTVAL